MSLGIASLIAVSRDNAWADNQRYFRIQIVDEQTGRGVPLVELETVNHLRFVTDSNGFIALDELDLMGRTIYFHIQGHGYEYPKDGFGYRGKALDVQPGGKARLDIKRVNIAERLYRVTGSGIYRDTELLKERVPLDTPLLSAGVFGCDSVMAAVYRQKIHWFWGDTTRPHYPLGANFHITGATSLLPQEQGFDPGTGVRFDYFVGQDGTVRPMAQMPGDGPTWISALTVLPADGGRERLYANYVKIRGQLESYRWGFVVWNDEARQFDNVKTYDRRPVMFFESQTHTFVKKERDGKEYVYFTNPLPLTRVEATPAAFLNPESYEGFTCLQAGTRAEDKQLDRGPDGRPRYSWKANTPALSQKAQSTLIKAGVMQPAEALIALRDADSGRAVHAHNGSVYWNEYRQRWLLITVELEGESSFLGEVWFAEADEPTGPWVYARKVATHDKYSFYNPKHHPFFDQEGGRRIFFEGTYTNTFAKNPMTTPRYDYNQVMYQLDLSVPALNLPVAFYEIRAPSGGAPFAPRQPDERIGFFALDRPGTGTVPVTWTGSALHAGASQTQVDKVLFHALPTNVERPPATTAPLHEFTHARTGERAYVIDPEWRRPGYERSREPICRVWKAPVQSGAARMAD